MTGIRWRKMMQGERDKLLQMEDAMHRRVVGQDEAVRLVSDAIRRSRAGIGIRSGVWLVPFSRTTGVGKTELTKTLAEFRFDSEDNLIRIDMSELHGEALGCAAESGVRPVMWVTKKAVT